MLKKRTELSKQTGVKTQLTDESSAKQTPENGEAFDSAFHSPGLHHNYGATCPMSAEF